MVGQKSKPQTFVITSPNIDCNSNFFHRYILWKICNQATR